MSDLLFCVRFHNFADVNTNVMYQYTLHIYIQLVHFPLGFPRGHCMRCKYKMWGFADSKMFFEMINLRTNIFLGLSLVFLFVSSEYNIYKHKHTGLTKCIVFRLSTCTLMWIKLNTMRTESLHDRRYHTRYKQVMNIGSTNSLWIGTTGGGSCNRTVCPC